MVRIKFLCFFSVSGNFIRYSQFVEVFPVAVILFAKATGDDAGMNANVIGEGDNLRYA